jgi:hypothetical protein
MVRATKKGNTFSPKKSSKVALATLEHKKYMKELDKLYNEIEKVIEYLKSED